MALLPRHAGFCTKCRRIPAPSVWNFSAKCARQCRQLSKFAIIWLALPKNGVERVMLAGLEHLDERYVKAVGYATKAKRHGRPKMVLIGDIVGDDDNQVALAASEVVRLCNARGAEGFIAVSPETPQNVLAGPGADRGDSQTYQRLQN